MPRILSLGRMVQLIAGLTLKDGVNEWEMGFCVSMDQITDYGQDTTMLSSKQIEMIERLHDEHFT